jgi:site-specific DNA recombinase
MKLSTKQTAVVLIPAVGYIRMSTDEQELSPEQQRREIEEYAKRHGYVIVRWYSDEGISASKGDEIRLGYQRLLIDSNNGDFRAVLCWSTSRFTRNHPHEAAEGKRILKNNGIWLDTVKEGKIDWNSFEGMIKDSIYNIIDHTYSVGLGKDSLRGRRNTFLAGGYPFGSIPYGYNHLYLCGAERREVKRGTKTKNLRGWIHSLTVIGEEAEIVRRIFYWYVNHDMSLAGIARKLNELNIPGPGKGIDARWTVQIVRTRLRCSAYAGISRIGGKPEHYRGAHNRLDAEERQGDWPVIIDCDTWNRAQEKLTSNQASPHEGKSGALQGIVRCGVCGYVLHKENPRKASDVRGNKYRCRSRQRGCHTHCHDWTAYESELMPTILRELVRTVDEETLNLLQAAPEQPGRVSNKEALQSHLSSLEERISKAADSFCDPAVSPTMKKALEKKVEEWESQAVETKHKLDALSVADDLGGWQKWQEWWREVRPQLLWVGSDGAMTEPSSPAYVFADDNGSAEQTHPFDATSLVWPQGKLAIDPGKLRSLLKRLNVQVKIYWRRAKGSTAPKKRGRQTEWVVDKARLQVEIFCGSSDAQNALASLREFSHREDSHRRAIRAPLENP